MLKILRQIFGPNTDVNGEWRRFHNEELHSLYCSPNIVRVIKCTRLSWEGHGRIWECSQNFIIYRKENVRKAKA